MTTAFVLSGGGIRGPLEVGALQSLFEHGIKPDFFAGTSAGAINAAYMAAAGPDLANIPGLQAAWRKGSKDIVYPGTVLTILWRILMGADSLLTSDGMRRLIQENLPPSAHTFADLKCPCYLTSVDLKSGRLYVFGDPSDPTAPLVDAVMASSSIPVLQPPVMYHDLELVDGGVVAATPAAVAMDRGANVIYAINVGRGVEPLPEVHGVLNIFWRTIDTFTAQNLFEDLARAAADPAITLHHIHIGVLPDLAFNDFSHIEEMFTLGKQAMDEYLASPQPMVVAPLAGVAAPAAPAPHRVPGAVEFMPRRR